MEKAEALKMKMGTLKAAAKAAKKKKNTILRLSSMKRKTCLATLISIIKPQIERLFADYPEEKSLSEVVPDSRWVRIKYDDGEYYVVGVLYDKDRPLYLCYGVEGRYGEKPEKINEYCSFIPSSLFNLKGDGYWVMFQRATNGECVK